MCSLCLCCVCVCVCVRACGGRLSHLFISWTFSVSSLSGDGQGKSRGAKLSGRIISFLLLLLDID